MCSENLVKRGCIKWNTHADTTDRQTCGSQYSTPPLEVEFLKRTSYWTEPVPDRLPEADGSDDEKFWSGGDCVGVVDCCWRRNTTPPANGCGDEASFVVGDDGGWDLPMLVLVAGWLDSGRTLAFFIRRATTTVTLWPASFRTSTASWCVTPTRLRPFT